MRYDPRRPVAYPDNGRLLTDDVGDSNVAIFTKGKVTEDGVAFPADFARSIRDWIGFVLAGKPRLMP